MDINIESGSTQIVWVRRISHRIHRIHRNSCGGYSPTDFRSTQIVWVRRFSHRIHRIHRNSCGGYSPTDFTDLHRLFGCVDSPTDFTDLHRLFGCLQGGALVSSAPTELRWCTSCYVGALETSAPPEVSSFCVNLCNLWEAPLSKKFCVNLCNLWEALCCCGGKDTSATIFRSLTICKSVQSVGGPLFARLVHFLLGWCT